MSAQCYILVSNIALPSNRIGSWVTRMDSFNERNDLFDFILSPSKASEKHIFCKKRSFITWNKRLRKFNLLHRVAKDYVAAIKKLAKQNQQLTIVVMDDPHLLESLILIKSELPEKTKLIFSFHGFQLQMSESVLQRVDKVLFLSYAGYQATKDSMFAFVPEVAVVGNCVNSEQFYPLEMEERDAARSKFGYAKRDKVLVWMANDRPIKGMHLFKKIARTLLEKHSDLKVMVLGSNQQIEGADILNIGRIPNEEIAKYLQLGDYYMFTSLCKEGFGLSMIEALKTGNIVLASKNGAIPEVLENVPNSYLVENPNELESWVSTFESAIQSSHKRISKEESRAIWNYEDWEQRFLNAIKN
ncbi:glycosyltransferase [Sungkyunkwania multivorans]|uniref:Glycosyltransferase n=1 Tax=Sungkyunkwania multivorans TaxID=1173618 RepID=A0ABW3D4L6_9FLAO